MTDITSKVRTHYNGPGLIERIKAAIATISSDDEMPTAAQLAPLDQFHTRGMLATMELAEAAGSGAATRVLDIGCGVGGPARYLAVTCGCHVTGIDLSPSFIDAAKYLTARAGLSDRVNFEVGDASNLPFKNESFDTIFLQHVAMNIEDRAGLYREVRRVLTPDGKFVVHDIVHRSGDVLFPVPWARDASTSFLLSEDGTRAALEQAGFRAEFWRDDTQSAIAWFNALVSGPPPGGLSLGVVMGPEFPGQAANLAQNLRDGRLGVLSAVLVRK